MSNLNEDSVFGVDYRYILESAVDWKKRVFKEKPFFEFIFKKYRVKTLLDLKSGTGNYILNLYGMYELAVGVDSNPYLVSLAEEKSEDFPGMHFISTDSKKLKNELRSRVLPQNYDCVLLSSNNLATIMNTENLKEYLIFINSLLSVNGILVISSFNYNKLLKEQDYDFGKINFNHDGSLFMLTRHMKIIDEELIAYEANIYDSSGHVYKEHRELHNPLTKKRLNEVLESSGFINLEFYGDTSFAEFDVDKSKRIIVIAQKKNI